MGTKEHKDTAPKNLTIVIISISTTRKMADDKSGQWISKHTKKEGHRIAFHQVVPDDIKAIQSTVLDAIRDYHPHALLLTGGTGISPKDLTIEAIRPLLTKELTAFGILFTLLSFDEIDSSALLSRAMAGVIDKTLVFCMPGSLNACKLACNSLIFPELGHLAGHLQET